MHFDFHEIYSYLAEISGLRVLSVCSKRTTVGGCPVQFVQIDLALAKNFANILDVTAVLDNPSRKYRLPLVTQHFVLILRILYNWFD